MAALATTDEVASSLCSGEVGWGTRVRDADQSSVDGAHRDASSRDSYAARRRCAPPPPQLRPASRIRAVSSACVSDSQIERKRRAISIIIFIRHANLSGASL